MRDVKEYLVKDMKYGEETNKSELWSFAFIMVFMWGIWSLISSLALPMMLGFVKNGVIILAFYSIMLVVVGTGFTTIMVYKSWGQRIHIKVIQKLLENKKENKK